MNNSDLSKERPIVQVGSYEQTTNNVRYWRTPNNGTCVRSELCNSIYDNKPLDKSQQIQGVNEPPILKFSQNGRVNYYKSNITNVNES